VAQEYDRCLISPVGPWGPTSGPPARGWVHRQPDPEIPVQPTAGL